MKSFARVLTVLLNVINTSFNDGIMLCPCPQWTSRVGSKRSNLLKTLGLLLLLPINNNNNWWRISFVLQMTYSSTAPPHEHLYPVPQSLVGYCPLCDFDGNTLTWSTAVWSSGRQYCGSLLFFFYIFIHWYGRVVLALHFLCISVAEWIKIPSQEIAV
jgi:hypothetical protein